MRKRNIILSNIIFLALLFVMIVSLSPCVTAKAESDYSNVLIDLRKDDTFDVNNYPPDINNNCLEVIQIAESVNKELFIYVYQPSRVSRRLNATHIHISRETGDNFSPQRYSLKLVSSVNVFCKYIVEDFEVSSADVRYYDVVSIMRKYDSSIDDKDSIVEVGELAFEVGRLYTVITKNGESIYSLKESETIEVTGYHAGFVRYSNGFVLWGNDSCDSWFIAFKTDRDIEKLFEAEVFYCTQSYHGLMDGGELIEGFGEKIPEITTLYCDDMAENPANRWWGKKREWKRIQTAEEYCSNTELTDDVNAIVREMDFVLSFKETAYNFKQTSQVDGLYNEEQKTIISDVSILRLKFEKDGKVYNLGVVSDTFTPDNMPSNTPSDQQANDSPFGKIKELLLNLKESFGEFSGNMKNIITVIFGILIAIVAFLILCYLIKFIKFIVNTLFGKKGK